MDQAKNKIPLRRPNLNLKLNISLKKFRIRHFVYFASIIIIGTALILIYLQKQKENNLNRQILVLDSKRSLLQSDLGKVKSELNVVKNEDQYAKNKKLEEEIKNIHDNYDSLVVSYENLLDLKGNVKNTAEIDKLFAQALRYLSDKNYASASSNIDLINSKIKAEKEKLVSAFNIPQNVSTSNNAPGSGFSQQTVQTDSGNFLVSIVAGDLNSTRVIVDTASESDCKDNCPVFPLANYVARNNAYAGINGSYFCPTSYPSCAGKTNSFDTLLMNKNKKYFNSDNNVYSTVPVAVFSGNSARFVGQSLEWGRDTGVDAVIANYPLLISAGQVVYGGSDNTKLTSKGPRCFIANKGSTVYIGIVYNADLRETAKALKTLEMDNALNLDEGGSTGLWFGGGYKAGPGRDIPNAILFVRK